MPRFLGIDPGANGAISLIEGRDLFEILDCPLHADKSLDHVELGRIVKSFAGSTMALIEHVGPIPHKDKKGNRFIPASDFEFAINFGSWVQAMACAGIHWRTIAPAEWKRTMGVTSDKQSSVDAAVRLYPGAASLFYGPRRGLMDGRAESTLLANLASRMWKLSGGRVAA